MEKIALALKQQKSFLIFSYLILISTLLTFIAQEIIITDKLLVESYQENMTQQQIMRMLSFRESYSWASYLLNVVVYLLKFLAVSICLYIGLFLNNYRVKLSDLFKNVLISEFILLLYLVFRFIMVYFNDFESVQHIQNYWPLSLLSLIDSNELAPYYKLPLVTFNIGQVLYWFILTYFISRLLNNHFWQSFKVVMSSYGIGLITWFIVVVFVQLYII